MDGRIIRIGNSRGIIIPSVLLRELSLTEKDKVTFRIESGHLVIEKESGFNGPFTGPFASLAKFREEEDPWGDDPCEYVRNLRDSSGAEKREIPEL